MWTLAYVGNSLLFTLFHMIMGQYDPDWPSLPFIATISVLGFQKFLTLFFFETLYVPVRPFLDILFQKS